MVALLLKSAKESSALTPHFGKAKAFALYNPESGQAQIFANENPTGNALIAQLKSLNVTDLVVQGMGPQPFNAALANGLKVWFAGTERLALADAIRRFRKNELISVTPENEALLRHADHEEHKHPHAHGSCCSPQKTGQGLGRGLGIGFHHGHEHSCCRHHHGYA